MENMVFKKKCMTVEGGGGLGRLLTIFIFRKYFILIYFFQL